jgi:hypothetical protein
MTLLAKPQSSPFGPIILVRLAMGISVANVVVAVLGVGVEVGGAVTSACRSGVCEVCVAVVLGLFTMRSLLIL